MVRITHYTSPNLTDNPQVNIHWIQCIEHYFTVQDFWATCTCPENFLCIEYIFYHSGFLGNLRLPWKTVCPENFNCIEYTFFIQDFWATCTCTEKQSVLWIHCIEYIAFIIQDFWLTCTCPGKQLSWNFSLYWNILSFRIFEQPALVLKKVCPEFTV